MNEKVYVELLTPLSLKTREQGERVIRLWTRCLPTFVPERIGNFEPIAEAFDRENTEPNLRVWQWPFLAQRRKPRMDGQVFMRKGSAPQHAAWILSVDYDPLTVDELVDFVSTASVELQADLGCLTLLTASELISGRQNGTVTALDKQATRFGFFIPNPYLQRSLPDVYWLTVFGQAYVRYFGLDSLLAAPGYKTTRLGDQCVRIQLTAYLEDMHRVAEFTTAKARLKAYLGESAFTADPTGASGPVFDWE
jgi:hypothetical protein